MISEPPPDAEARKARRILWWCIGTVIAFNLGLLLFILLPRR
jgi:hypothetical protein